MPDRCPLCGSLVQVYTAGEGTCSYEPVAEKAIRWALDVIEECAAGQQLATGSGAGLGRIREILRRGLRLKP